MYNTFGAENESKREFWIEKKLLKIPAGLTILDAGAGDQHHRKNCSHLKYFSQDFGQYNGVGNQKGLQTGEYNYGKIDIISDITNIPQSNESFDVILCSEVLEHIPSPDLAIKEFSRLLKKEGTLLLTAPFCSLTHFAPHHYHTGFNSYWYEFFLERYEFEIISIESYGNYFEYLAQEMRRLPFVAKSYCADLPIFREELELINNMINLLSNLSSKSSNSWELLNFGFLIEAKKRG